MTNLADVRRVALELPGATEPKGDFAFEVDGRKFAWRWLERVHPKRARVPSDEVIGVRIAHDADKAILIDMNPAVFFTEPHYDGYPAILVRLADADEDLLRLILTDGWRSRLKRRVRPEQPRAAADIEP